MKHRGQLTQREVVDIIHAWKNNLSSMTDLAKKYGITRQGIYKALKRAGIDVSKRRLPVSCNTCGAEIMRTRKRLRTHKHIFCCMDCYRAWFKAISKYDTNGYGSRVAREIVRQHFALEPGNIVHHLNGHGTDNALDNLVVLRNQGDHLRMHRDFDVIPIWQGSLIEG